VAEEEPSFLGLSRRVAELYRATGDRAYVRAKLRIDPVARALHARGVAAPFGEVLDLGCGRGQVALLLAAAGLATAVTAVDWDEAKVRRASLAARALPQVRFSHGDARTVALPEADTVLLLDVLHYLTPEEQDALLVRAARAARARVVVRDVDPDRGAASLFTEGWERITTALGYNRGARVAPRPLDALCAVLEAEGLTVTREPCTARALSNALLVAERRGPRPATSGGFRSSDRRCEGTKPKV
jgi:SAM-dependent methyltransferase